jgi:hypothetical protein
MSEGWTKTELAPLLCLLTTSSQNVFGYMYVCLVCTVVKSAYEGCTIGDLTCGSHVIACDRMNESTCTRIATET